MRLEGCAKRSLVLQYWSFYNSSFTSAQSGHIFQGLPWQSSPWKAVCALILRQPSCWVLWVSRCLTKIGHVPWCTRQRPHQRHLATLANRNGDKGKVGKRSRLNGLNKKVWVSTKIAIICKNWKNKGQINNQWIVKDLGRRRVDMHYFIPRLMFCKGNNDAMYKHEKWEGEKD